MNQKLQEKEELVTEPISQPVAPVAATPVSRPPLSPLGKVAFWSLLVGTISGIGGTIVLASLRGSPSTASVVVAVFWVVTFLLFITRFRWASLVTTVTSGYILFALFTEPYSIASLSSPKDAQLGGLGHFIGSVLILACALLAFGANLGTAVENYRPGSSRKAPRWLSPALALVVGLVIGATFIGILAPSPTVVSATSYINGVPAVHMGATSFDQTSVTIPKGSSLVLVDDTSMVHILLNGSWQNGTPVVQKEPGAPVLNGLQVSGKSVTIGPFNVAGTYHILCSIHQGMNLTVIVQ